MFQRWLGRETSAFFTPMKRVCPACDLLSKVQTLFSSSDLCKIIASYNGRMAAYRHPHIKLIPTELGTVLVV